MNSRITSVISDMIGQSNPYRPNFPAFNDDSELNLLGKTEENRLPKCNRENYSSTPAPSALLSEVSLSS